MASRMNRYTGLADLITRSRRDTTAAEDLQVIGRAFAGATTADVGGMPKWIATEAKDLTHPMLSAFGPVAPIPATGNLVEFTTTRTEVGGADAQTEGENLASLKVTLESDTAPVITIGVYSEISADALRDKAYLAEVLSAQNRHFSARAGIAVRAALVGMGADTAATVAVGDLLKAEANRSAILDAIDDIEDANGTASVVILPRADLRRLAKIVDADGVGVFVTDEDLGTLAGSKIRGRIAGLPILVDRGLTAGTGYVVDKDGIKVLASTPVDALGQMDPRRLSNVANLSGYVAITEPHAEVIKKVAFAA